MSIKYQTFSIATGNCFYTNTLVRCVRCKTKASTIRAYLNDLVDFAKYLIATEENLEDLSFEKINVVMRSLQIWRKGYVMKAGRENQKRHKNEQQNLISQGDVQKFDEGENAVNARQIFKCLEENVDTVSDRLNTISKCWSH